MPKSKVTIRGEQARKLWEILQSGNGFEYDMEGDILTISEGKAK